MASKNILIKQSVNCQCASFVTLLQQSSYALKIGSFDNLILKYKFENILKNSWDSERNSKFEYNYLRTGMHYNCVNHHYIEAVLCNPVAIDCLINFGTHKCQKICLVCSWSISQLERGATTSLEHYSKATPIRFIISLFPFTSFSRTS